MTEREPDTIDQLSEHELRAEFRSTLRKSKAIQNLEVVGEEVSWEIIGTEGWWYVVASHRGSDNPSDNFRFEARRRDLADAIGIIAKLCCSAGPDWIRNAPKAPN